MSHSPSQPAIENDEYSAGWSALFELLYGGGSFSGRERNCCFLNTGKMPFIDISAVAGFDFPDDGRAIAKVDWDHDGRLDVWTVNRSAPRARFLKNVSSNENNYVAFHLKGKTCNRDAIGAKVKVRLQNGRVLVETLSAGAGYLSQSSKWIHFGLGNAKKIESISVNWPGKDSGPELFKPATINGRFELVQGSGIAKSVPRFENRTLQLPSREIEPETLSDSNRVILAGRVPVYPFQYEDVSGQTTQFSPGGQPTLVNFWASWCTPCVSEIQAFAASAELNDQLNIILLSGDVPKDRPTAQHVLSQANWQGTSGYCSPSSMDYFDTLQKSLLSHKQAMPVPTSFLIDHEGNLVAIYKGTVKVEQLLTDLKLCRATPDEIWQAAIPFPGRWFEKPDVAAHSKIAIATQFTKLGYTNYASKYLSAITDRIALEPMAEDAEARMTLAGAQVNLASQFYDQGNTSQAIDLLKDAIRFSPGFAKAHFNLGVIYVEQGNFPAAVESFENALNSDPNHAYANFNLGTIFEVTKPVMAVNYYSRAIESDPQFTKARYNLGLLSIRSGNLESAEAQFRAILNYERNADAYYQLGNIALQINDLETAMEQFNQAIALDAQHTDAMTNLAAVLFSTKKFERALDFLGQVAVLKPDDAKSQFNYAVALLQNAKYELAISQIKKTLKINKDYPTATLRLAQAIVLQPDASSEELKVAIEYAKRSAQSQPTTAPAAANIIQQAEARFSEN